MKIPNTFGLNVEAAVFLEYGSVEELEKLIADGRITSPYLHIGGGSNLLFTGNYEGVILHSRIGGIEVTAENEEKVSVRVGAGVVWDDFVDYCTERGWYGTENLSLIPGEVGAQILRLDAGDALPHAVKHDFYRPAVIIQRFFRTALNAFCGNKGMDDASVVLRHAFRVPAPLLNIVAFKMVFQYFFQLLRLAVIQMRKHLPNDVVYQFIFHNPISAVFMREHG